MKTNTPQIANAGDLERERVIFRASEDQNLTYLAIFRCATGTTADAYRAGPLPNVYWFQPYNVKAGDFVVVYSKDGKTGTKTTQGDVTSHFFYWRRSEPLWTPSFRAVLVSTPDWVGAELQPMAQER